MSSGKPRSPVPTNLNEGETRIVLFLDGFKRFLVFCITGMMVVVLLLAVIELAYYLVRDIITPPFLLLDVAEMLSLFGLFLIVLIGIELVETLEIYLKENVIHVEVVFTVALIAIARKVIILDYKKMPSDALFAIAAVILALSLGYFLIQRSLQGDRGDSSTRAAESAPAERSET